MATFGYQNIGLLSTSIANGLICRFQMNNEDGNLQSISVYVKDPLYATLVNCAIYLDNNGAPDALIAQGTSVTLSTAGWYTTNINAQLNASQYYWLATRADGKINFAWDAGGSANQTNTSTLPGITFQNPWDIGVYSDFILSIYATYDPILTRTLSPTDINNELDSLGLIHDGATTEGNYVRVDFSNSKKDHHETSFYQAKKYYLSGQSTIAQIYLIGDYYLILEAK